MNRNSIIFAMLCLAALLSAATAQEVITLENVPSDLIQADDDEHPGTDAAAQVPVPVQEPASTGEAVDLGQNLSSSHATTPIPIQPSVQTGIAVNAVNAALSERHTRRPPPKAAALRAGVERTVFEREPVSVPLPVGTERLITLPAPAALHVPSDMAQVARLQVIDRTIYATALAPFTPIRIVAELIDTGQQIPMDLVANTTTANARAELEVFAVSARATGGIAAGGGEASILPGDQAAEKPAPDMVELTRHAARQLYAPRRLAVSAPGVQQTDVDTGLVPGLMRGVNVETAPVGQWRAGQLYVTAVRVTNRSRYPVELPLEDIRGRWLSATAQHGRIGPAGSETDTTAVYLVCDRAFEACLN